MGRDLDCLRCGNLMQFVKSEKLQLGQTGWFWGDIPNLMAGSLETDIYICDECGKIEFYQTKLDHENLEDQEDQIAQIKCPNCGKTHDIDYPKCPFCKYDYYANEHNPLLDLLFIYQNN